MESPTTKYKGNFDFNPKTEISQRKDMKYLEKI